MSNPPNTIGRMCRQDESCVMETRPPLLKLGGEENFRLYRQEFQRLYQARTVTDVLGNRMEFSEAACRHVCFKGDEEDRYSRSRREN